jgi:hypothetical protein
MPPSAPPTNAAATPEGSQLANTTAPTATVAETACCIFVVALLLLLPLSSHEPSSNIGRSGPAA